LDLERNREVGEPEPQIPNRYDHEIEHKKEIRKIRERGEPEPQIPNHCDHHEIAYKKKEVKKTFEVTHIVDPNLYPSKKDMKLAPNSSRLICGFNVPYQLHSVCNPRLWSQSGCIIRQCSFDSSPIYVLQQTNIISHGIALNEIGNIAILTSKELKVFTVHESNFIFYGSHIFKPKWVDFSKPIRVRYSQNIVYVFANYTILRFVVIQGTLKPIQPFTDEDMKEQDFRDIVVTDKFIIGVWKEWCGLYNKDNFEWYQAVAHNSSVRQSFQIEMLDGYVHIGTGSTIAAFHIASNEIQNLWCVGNVENGEEFCVSKNYGIFTTQNNKNVIQSLYNARNVHSIFEEKKRNDY
jgi:hypothetical protein